jgi:hypothetical protein
MLKHNPKLKKLWSRAKKKKDKDGNITLDMRYKTSKEYVQAFAAYSLAEASNPI